MSYLLVYPAGDCDTVELLSIGGIAVADWSPLPLPRLGPDGEVDTDATVRLPDGRIASVLTLDIIDINEDIDLD